MDCIKCNERCSTRSYNGLCPECGKELRTAIRTVDIKTIKKFGKLAALELLSTVESGGYTGAHSRDIIIRVFESIGGKG